MNKINRKIEIPYGKQFIDKQDILTVSKALKSKLITTGEYVTNFEKKIKETVKVKFATSCINGTAGLHLAFLAINLKKNDVVLMPAINFISAYRVANLMGAKIYLLDVDPFTGQITPETLLKAIKLNKLKKIKAIVTMYMGGYPENNLNFYKIKKKYNCYLIEDACHAFGAKYKFRNKFHHIGSCKHSDISVFSFHPVKTITTGEGGAVTTNNKSFAKRIVLYKNHSFIRQKKYWHYDIKKLGNNYRLSDINCALGLSQIKKLNKFINYRKKVFLFYKKELEKFKKYIRLPNYNEKNYSSYHLFLISLNLKYLSYSKDKLFNFLNYRNIYPQYHYMPIFKFSFYKNKNNTKYYGASEYYKNTLSLPIYFGLKKKEQIHIIKSLFKFIKMYKRS